MVSGVFRGIMEPRKSKGSTQLQEAGIELTSQPPRPDALPTELETAIYSEPRSGGDLPPRDSLRVRLSCWLVRCAGGSGVGWSAVLVGLAVQLCWLVSCAGCQLRWLVSCVGLSAGLDGQLCWLVGCAGWSAVLGGAHSLIWRNLKRHSVCTQHTESPISG